MQFVIICLLLSLLFASLTNVIRFAFPPNANRMIALSISLVFIEMITYVLQEPMLLEWMFLFLILVGAISFSVVGGITTALVSLILVMIQIENLTPFIVFSYASVGLTFGLLQKYTISKIKQFRVWTSMLMKQSKRLNVFHEVSITIQQTQNLNQILHIILTAVTAGHGLGFNRAIIFLKSEDGKFLKGKMAIGPMSAESGYDVWEHIASEKYKLKDLIELNEGGHQTDNELNFLVNSLKIPLEQNEKNILIECLESQKPKLVKNVDLNDNIQVTLNELLKMNEFAIIPLINQGKKIGVIVIDNIVNQEPITMEQIESVIPFANQASAAIDHSKLYFQTQEMALKDGLTGLYNQRAFQDKVQQYDYTQTETPITLAILDIDHFKHYNDTNGHLLGNKVLIDLSQIIKQTIRMQDIAFRFGGEEFVVLFPETNLVEAYQQCENFRREIERAPFPNREQQPGGKLTVSIGIASTEVIEVHSANELIHAADLALYESKELGRNRSSLYKGGASQ